MDTFKISLTFNVTKEDLRQAQAICKIPLSSDEEIESFREVNLDADLLQQTFNSSDYDEFKQGVCALAVILPVMEEKAGAEIGKSKFQQRLDEAIESKKDS